MLHRRADVAEVVQSKLQRIAPRPCRVSSCTLTTSNPYEPAGRQHQPSVAGAHILSGGCVHNTCSDGGRNYWTSELQEELKRNC